jgi:Nuclear pore protein 84 / 107
MCCLQAQRVCTKIGQMWRAATLAGWQLYHDPNVEELGQGGSIQSVEGNQYRDIWKAACWKASEDVSLSSYGELQTLFQHLYLLEPEHQLVGSSYIIHIINNNL